MTTTELSTPTASRHEPVQIAPDTWVIQATHGEGTAPVAVHMNAMVVRGAQPLVVDTGAPVNRDQYLTDLFGLVEPDDVRWVFISHDDADHHGNLHAVMDACPNATLIANWFLCERLATERLDIPPTRWCWLDDGETLDLGDRTVAAIRPPVYDSPTTRGLFDARTGVYWAADAYAAPVERATAFVTDLDHEAWADGFCTFQVWTSPWVTSIDPAAHAAACARIEALDVNAIAGAHGPTVGAASVAEAHTLMREARDRPVPAQPGQPVLDEIVASLLATA